MIKLYRTITESQSNETCQICESAGKKEIISTKDIAFGTEEEFMYLRCLDCKHIWLYRTPIVKQRMYLEPTNAFVTRVMDHPIVRFAVYQPRIHWLNERIHLNSGLSILDVGCGTGQFLALLHRQYGSKCFGIEIDPYYTRLPTKSGVNMIIADFEKPAINQRFDLITMFHVLEHFSEPYFAIQQAYEMLNPGGYLCVETPAADSMSFVIFKNFWFPLLPPYHRHVFSRQSLKTILSGYFSQDQLIDRDNIYIAGEMMGSAILPLLKFIPHPFQKNSLPVLNVLAASLGIGITSLLTLPLEILIAVTIPFLKIAGHQRVLFRRSS